MVCTIQTVPETRTTRLPILFYGAAVVFWVCLIYAPVDTFGSKGVEDAFQLLMLRETMNVRWFQWMAIGVASLCLLLFPRSPMPRMHKAFLTITALAVLVNLFNPNNVLSTQEWVFGPTTQFYILFFFAYVFLGMRNDAFAVVMEQFWLIGISVAVLRSLQGLALFMLGRGMTFIGVSNATITSADTLYALAMFQVMCLGAYLNTRQRRYLASAGLFIIVMFFSYRRSALYVAFLGDLGLTVYYLFRTGKLARGVVGTIVVTSLVIGAVFFVPDSVTDKISIFAGRYLGALSFMFPSLQTQRDFSDSGHMEESVTTTETMLANLDRFWGAGLGNRPYYVQGQTADYRSSDTGKMTFGGIHNSFANAWASWGIHMTLYMIYVLVFAIVQVRKAIRGSPANYFAIGCCIALMFDIAMGWINGYTFLTNTEYIVRFGLLLATYKFSLADEEAEEEAAQESESGDARDLLPA